MLLADDVYTLPRPTDGDTGTPSGHILEKHMAFFGFTPG